MLDEINYQLLAQLGNKPHPNTDNPHNETPRSKEGLLWDARTCHHLLDIGGIPRGTGYEADLDARVYLMLRRNLRQAEIIDRIKDQHARETAEGGMVGSFCVECGSLWPCETYMLAVGQLDENEAESRE